MSTTLPLLLIPEPISPATLKAFASHPWCLELFQDPKYTPVQSIHQSPTPTIPSGLMSVVLRDHDAILAVQSLYYGPSGDASDAADMTRNSQGKMELHTVYLLGTGASGHVGISHGGLTAALLDQQAGSLAIADPTADRAQTVSLHIRYLRPVFLPGAVRVRAWKTKVEGRKHWVMAELTDSMGVVLATAEGVFINGKRKL